MTHCGGVEWGGFPSACGAIRKLLPAIRKIFPHPAREAVPPATYSRPTAVYSLRETQMDMHNPMKLLCLAGATLSVLLAVSPAAAADGVRTLIVQAGKHDRVGVPVSVEAPAEAAFAAITLDSKPVACQVADGKLWFVVDKLAAGKSATYQVRFIDNVKDLPSVVPGPGGKVALAQGGKQVDVSIGGKPFTSYVFDYGKVGKHELCRPYFWPVYGPDQTTMTRPYPMQFEDLPKNVQTDHPHHTSIWVAHGDVNKVDNWSIGSRAGWQIHKDFPLLASGPVVGILRETLDWTEVAVGKPNLAETRTIRFYALPCGGRLMDIDLTFEAKYGKVTFGDTKEGGPLATRMRPEFRDDKHGNEGVLLNSDNQRGKAAWGRKARWVDCSGLVDGKRYGFAIFDAPGNLRHPSTWHARTYGLCSINPFGLHDFPGGKGGPSGDWTIDAGSSATQRYRIYFHAGDAKAAGVEARWQNFADPPVARWK